jgi:hypothetical protein
MTHSQKLENEYERLGQQCRETRSSANINLWRGRQKEIKEELKLIGQLRKEIKSTFPHLGDVQVERMAELHAQGQIAAKNRKIEITPVDLGDPNLSRNYKEVLGDILAEKHRGRRR